MKTKSFINELSGHWVNFSDEFKTELSIIIAG